MTERTSEKKAQSWLTRGGEMGALMHSFDWSTTPVGPISAWPQSLKSLVKTLLASRYPMVLTWGANFTQFYNDAYSHLIGDKHPAALGIDIRVTLAEAWDTLGPMIEKVMTTGIANWTPALLLVLERSGYREESYFSVSHAPAEDDSGCIVGMLAVCSEVTQQILGERRLRLLRDLASKAGEARSVEATCRDAIAAIALYRLDVPFALLYLREQDGKTFTLRGVVGLGQSETVSPHSVVGIEDQEVWSLARAASGETVVVEEVERYVNVLGGPWNELVRSALVMPIASSGQSAPLGVLVAGISPNRALDEGYRSFYELLAGQVSVLVRNAQLSEEERRRAEALAELDRAKTTFFSNISHEFRTPLTLMLGPLEDALSNLDKRLEPTEREQLQMVQRNGRRLLKLVNTLLDFSRIEAGRVQASYQPTDLSQLTAELASVFRSALERVGLRLIVDCPTLPEPVYVDPEMWEKIVLNLLSNAFKFTFKGEVGVRLRSDQDHVQLEVWDTGTGIPASELPQLFERFHRVQGAKGRTFEGSGIGLSLVQELVRLHGGSIDVTSQVDQGSCFTVSIPTGSDHLFAAHLEAAPRLASTALGAAAYVEEGTREECSTSPQPLASSSSSARILLADDNADMRDYLQRLLRPYYQVEAVADGVAALAAVHQQLPDLVLSDVMMPGLDGFQLLQQLRTEPRTQEVPIILVSARAGEESRIEGLSMGADDYLTKPFSARELIARVRTNLELSRLRKQANAERSQRIREQAAREEAEAANRMKDEFLLALSHEIRTPLNGMLGWVMLLQQGKLDSTATKRALETIKRNAKAQAKLVDDLLDVSRIIRGQLHLEQRPLSLISVITTVLETIRPEAQAKSITLEPFLDLAADFVSGDATRLQQVIGNLLANAVKFTPQGGRVEVWLEPMGTNAQMRVKDTGIGISQDFLPYVFERFRQADGGTTRRYGGLGLGLAIVRHLVEMHGGVVQATSPGEGQGATFIVRLPLLSPPHSSGVASTTSSQERGIFLNGLRALVVDDEVDALDLAGFILQQQGVEVTEAASAAEALAVLPQVQPHILISDLGMPGADGYDLIRQVRALPAEQGGRIPAIALTAYAKEEDRKRALLAGFQMHLVKPFEPEALIMMIAKLSERL